MARGGCLLVAMIMAIQGKASEFSLMEALDNFKYHLGAGEAQAHYATAVERNGKLNVENYELLFSSESGEAVSVLFPLLIFDLVNDSTIAVSMPDHIAVKIANDLGGATEFDTHVTNGRIKLEVIDGISKATYSADEIMASGSQEAGEWIAVVDDVHQQVVSSNFPAYLPGDWYNMRMSEVRLEFNVLNKAYEYSFGDLESDYTFADDAGFSYVDYWFLPLGEGQTRIGRVSLVSDAMELMGESVTIETRVGPNEMLIANRSHALEFTFGSEIHRESIRTDEAAFEITHTDPMHNGMIGTAGQLALRGLVWNNPFIETIVATNQHLQKHGTLDLEFELETSQNFYDEPAAEGMPALNNREFMFSAEGTLRFLNLMIGSSMAFSLEQFDQPDGVLARLVFDVRNLDEFLDMVESSKALDPLQVVGLKGLIDGMGARQGDFHRFTIEYTTENRILINGMDLGLEG